MSSEPSATRIRILDATIHILEQIGGKGVRMGDIAKQAGISRQALYLHFASRTELLVAATRHLDEKLHLDERLAPSRAAADGRARLELFIEFWGNYIPDIYCVAKALLVARETDDAAAVAWEGRMQAMRDGCRAAVNELLEEGILAQEWSADTATDLLWTLLQVPNWERLTRLRGWSNQEYIGRIKIAATRALVDADAAPVTGNLADD